MIIIELKERYKLEVKCFCKNILSKKGFIFSDSGFKHYDLFEDKFEDVDEELIRGIIEGHCVNWYGFDVLEMIYPQEDFPYLLNHQLDSYERFMPLREKMKPISQVNKMRKDILNVSSKIGKKLSKNKSPDDSDLVLMWLVDELVFMDGGIFYKYDKPSKMFQQLSSKDIGRMVSHHFNESDVHFNEEDYVPHLPTSDLIPEYNHQMKLYNTLSDIEGDFHEVNKVVESFQ